MRPRRPRLVGTTREGLVALALVAVLFALYAGEMPTVRDRARATEWFATSGPLRVAMHTHYALTGEWNPPAESIVGETQTSATRCLPGDGKIACEFTQQRTQQHTQERAQQGAPQHWLPKPSPRLVLVPVASAGSVNWACERSAAAGDAWRWFQVCAGGQPFEQAASNPGER